MLGRYVLGPRLGSGGMATVTFGIASGALGFARPVAIKRIHATPHESSELRAAIRDEARIASRVRHPNVVSVLDVVEEGDEIGIVLEYIHGETLAALLRRCVAQSVALPLGVTLSIIVDILHGLHAAHAARDERGFALDIVHRDVSPQNVLVGADGIARVLDFGIAKAHNRFDVTRDGVVKGKLSYMAPEQLGGDVSPATDTYAAGLVLWEALAGRPPFAGVDNYAALMARVLAGVFDPPSKYCAQIPAAVDAIIAKALALNAQARFATAAEMAGALEATGLLATRSAVAAIVNQLAREVLDARARVVALLERGLPADDAAPVVALEKTSAEPVMRDAPRRTGRHRLVPALAVLLLAAIPASFAAQRFMLSRARLPIAEVTPADIRPSATSEPVIIPSTAPLDLPPPPASAPAVASGPSVVAVAPSPLPSNRARARRPKARENAPPDCSVPYTVDADGYRSYRRECFE